VLQRGESDWFSGRVFWGGLTKTKKLAAKSVLLVGFGVFTNSIGVVIIFSAN
jgi:hypothetical protein